ncbi:hypothetical protein JCM1840_003873 [Sporobolomyces johnsonii]
MLSSFAAPASFESTHVHAVYDEIASDFSRTRHSRWPFVERFLDQLHPGSIVLDAGTGNGKYLGCRSVLDWEGKADEGKPRGKGKGKAVEPVQAEKEDVPTRKNNMLNVGFDMSAGLLGIASGKGHEVVRGDCVDLSCWRRGAFDHAISIATIHHFATPERRTEAIKQMILAVLPPSPPSSSPRSSSASASPPPESQLLIVVWSLEQDPSLLGARSARRTTGGKKGAIPVPSASQAEEEEEPQDAQDVFVPWERQEQQVKQPKPPRRARAASAPHGSSSTPSTSPPYDPATDSTRLSPLPPLAAIPADSPPSTPPSDSPSQPVPAANSKPTFNRYYHLFRQYELSSLVQSAASQLGFSFAAPDDYPLDKSSVLQEEKQGWEVQVRIKEERWERENWVVEAGVAWRRASGSSSAPE